MSDRAVVALALAVALGAWCARPAPLVPAVAGVALALAARRPAVLIVAALVVASSLGARSWAGLTPPPAGQPVAGTATLVTDPEWTRFGELRMEMRIGGRRVAASARGVPASRLVLRMAGQRVHVEGTVRPLTGRAAPYLRRRHVGARYDVTAASEVFHPGAPFDRVANHVRRLLERGAASFPPERRALYAGFLLGDDRHQSAASVYDFRASGLSHLLAVSGQNVAFVLAIAAPALRRLRLPARFAAGVVVLVLFGVLTRWEPTVLRAVGMATVALLATTIGRPASSLRLLALAVTVLLLIDPLLVGSVGFGLSVAASAGIVVLAPAVRRRLPGPQFLAEPVSVTIAAQAAVAPILVATFDGVPVSSLPANLLAGPAAAPIMMWGLVGGVAAGLLGDAVATVLHLPTRLLVGWVAEVARWSASLPLGDIGRVEVGALGGLAALGFLGRRGPRLRRLALGLAALVVTWAALAPVVRATPAASGRELGFGARLWAHDGAAVLVVDRPDPVEVLTELRRRRIRRIDVLVAQSSSATTKVVVDTIATRVPARLVVRPSATAAGLYTVGALSVEVTGTGSRLKATVRT